MSYQVKAFNTAVEAENKMHDDAVARTYGFAGGLVPGVDVYAYLTHLPADRWGREWLERGTMSARFAKPVYDGDIVSVTWGDAAAGALELRDSGGDLCATATATLPADAATAPPADEIPVEPAPERSARPPASPDALGVGTVLGSLEFGYHADRAGAYLADVAETLPLYGELGVAHPGWLLRSANYVLVENVRLGPWIHVSSDTVHLGLVADGDRISVRGRVNQTYERKGHRFVELDVQWLAGDRAVMRATHTAIYEPRGVGRAPEGATA